jgi:hypothetical protein
VIKTGKVLNLKNVKEDVVDSDSFSRYFVVSELGTSLSAGKNSLAINGSSLLKNDSDVFLEVVDVNGNTLYTEVAISNNNRTYRDGISIVYSIHVYSNTPKGVGEIFILGTDVLGNVVKWSRQIEINPLSINKSRVRFYNQPTFEVNPFINNTSESDTVLVSAMGECVGLAKYPKTGTSIASFNFSTSKVEYIINRISGDVFSSDMKGKRFSLDYKDYIIQDVLTENSLQLSYPIVDSKNKVINSSGRYRIEYFPFNTANSTVNEVKKIGTAEIIFKNIDTFTGRLFRYKIYRSSINTPYNSECIADGTFADSECLTDTETPYRNESFLGKIISDESLKKHWFVNSPDVALVHSPDVLIDSFSTIGFDIDNSNKSKHIIVKSGEYESGEYVNYEIDSDMMHSGSAFNSNFLHLYSGTKYVLSCNIILKKQSDKIPSVDFYIKSSMESTKLNKTFDGNGIKIGTISSNDTYSLVKSFSSEFELDSDVNGTLVIYPSNCQLTL